MPSEKRKSAENELLALHQMRFAQSHDKNEQNYLQNEINRGMQFRKLGLSSPSRSTPAYSHLSRSPSAFKALKTLKAIKKKENKLKTHLQEEARRSHDVHNYAEMQKRKAISEGEVFNFTQNYSNFNFEDEYKKKRLRSAVTEPLNGMAPSLRSAVTEVYNGSGGYKHTRRSKTKRKTRRK